MSNVNDVNNQAQEETKKTCLHCKKYVKFSYDCEVCGLSFHPSCANQRKVLNSENKVYCCLLNESEVKFPKNFTEMDEKKLKSVVKDILNEFLQPFKKAMQSDLAEIKKSLQFVSDNFDDQKKTIDTILLEMRKLKEENNSLQIKVKEMEQQMSVSEQKEKECNLIITGVPKQEDEPKTVIKKLFKAMKVEVRETDIQDVYRIAKRENAPILIKFSNRELRLKLQKRIKEIRGIKVNECGLLGGDTNIYLNEDLTRFNQLLFKRTREFKKINGLKAAYVRNGKIYLKKSDQEDPIRIRCESDLKTQ